MKCAPAVIRMIVIIMFCDKWGKVKDSNIEIICECLLDR